MQRCYPLRTLLLAACASIALEADGVARAEAAGEFPLPESLRPAVAFWKRVYLEPTTSMGLLHDSQHLGVVYEVVDLGSVSSRRAREKAVESRRRHWRDFLLRMAAGGTPRTSTEELVLARLRAALGASLGTRDFKGAAQRIRFQLGQRDKFREGLIRSGASEDAMRSVFRERGLPEDLAYLPHVESSFNPHAYSKYGAAGLWQFMRSTGRRYLTVDYEVDERLDPMASTRAAARLLEENYEALGAWPLAITAYNHGRSGIQRAMRSTGSRDIGVIVEKYRSRTFGFASRNFYAQFLAARDIARSYTSYFGPLERDRPIAIDEVTLPFYLDVDVLRDHLGVAPEVAQHHNPALRPPVFRAGRRIPKGYTLRLPAGTVHPTPEDWLARVPPGLRYREQHRSRYYQVRRGETLSAIARRHGTSVGTLAALNNLPSRHRIFAGQVLQLPDSNSKHPPAARSIVSEAHAKSRSSPSPSAAEPSTAPAAHASTEEPAVAEASGGEDRSGASDAARATETTETAGAETERAADSSTAVAALDGSGRPSDLPPPLPEDSPWRRVKGGFVLVDSDETLGHFADWLEVPTRRLRQLNGISSNRKLQMGQRLRLDFSRVPEAEFLRRRIEYHKGIEEDFFGSYRIAGTVVHTLQRGESPWGLAHRQYGVPIWLIHRYNPDADLDNLKPGVELRIPVVERLVGS